ncbi:MAG: DNA ligase D [Candidatus Kapaibacterium sp.]
MAELKEYQKKRDPEKTPEPFGKLIKGGKNRFVVQKHDASRLHYDFRIEVGNLLASWAIPKGPSYDPDKKRLAVRTEDHPLDYMDFEGIIPEGQYGGGTVMVWDKGTYTGHDGKKIKKSDLEKQIEDGHLKIKLHGEKLKGDFSLILMKNRSNENKENWLFIKNSDKYSNKKEKFDQKSVKTGRSMKEIENENDPDTVDPSKYEGAEKSDFPKSIKPELCKLVDDPFDDDDWIFEVKFDGVRVIAFKNGDEVNLKSRYQKSKNKQYSTVKETLDEYEGDFVLDGEVVIINEKGLSDFQELQNMSEDKKELLRYYVFDILYYNGYDLKKLPLIKRKEILKKILPESPYVKYCDHIEGKGKTFFEEASKTGLEGIIAKKKDTAYSPGKRLTKWKKIKAETRQELIIAGYTPPEGRRKHFGSLVLAFYEKNAEKKLKYAGRVGTGFTDDDLKRLYGKMKPLERKTPPVDDPPEKQRITWLTPKLVGEIRFTEWTDDNRLRHPAFLGLREKDPEDVVKEVPSNRDNDEKSDNNTGNEMEIPPKVEISNKNKVFWPDEGYKKIEVIEYYEQIADYILPYLKDRPQSLLRNPDGIKKEGFFQKNVEGKVPDWITTHRIKDERNEKKIEYMLCQDKATLLFMANWGCIEINPWNSRWGSINNPDFMVFDLDPTEVEFKKVVQVANYFKEIFDKLGIPAYPKTSGSKGMHIYVPVKPEFTYKQIQNLVELLARQVNSEHPQLTSLERMPYKRKGKVYIDYLQNARGKTMAAPYCLRPRKHATVSAPLHWDEVRQSLKVTDYTIKTMPGRLEKNGDLWGGFFENAIDIKKVIKKLDKD